MKKYETEKDITDVVRSFETATISRTDWKHAEHLTVALHYLSNHDFDAAYLKMRDGIFNLLRAFKVDLSKEMPYHETLTIFWLKAVDDFRNKSNGYSKVELYNKMTEELDKDFPLKFYSRDFLFSDEARAKFVEPDLMD